MLYFRYVDAVMTIPKGTLFPMCGMNLAFNRELIGPAMYFGLMGDGQPIGRYDDMWAGWCIKVDSRYSFYIHIVRQINFNEAILRVKIRATDEPGYTILGSLKAHSSFS